MKLVILAFVSSLLLGGCAVHTNDHHHHGRHGHAKKHKHKHKKSCHPSQHWDGHKCRHKGKGRGARKHDR